MSVKPILFNTPMTQAILDGRKTETRRLVHPAHIAALQYPARLSHPEMTDLDYLNRYASAKYYVGDILYVRETWAILRNDYVTEYAYKADDKWIVPRWRPSIHMPKEAARIFLRVKDVRIERLKDITCAGIEAEGIESERPLGKSERLCEHCPLPENLKGVHSCGVEPIICEGLHCYNALERWEEEYKIEFAELWDSTVKRSELYRYGWDANPWVWVIEFERINESEANDGD